MQDLLGVQSCSKSCRYYDKCRYQDFKNQMASGKIQLQAYTEQMFANALRGNALPKKRRVVCPTDAVSYTHLQLPYVAITYSTVDPVTESRAYDTQYFMFTSPRHALRSSIVVTNNTLSRIIINCMGGDKAVSYTHLDVYKRQVLPATVFPGRSSDPKAHH